MRSTAIVGPARAPIRSSTICAAGEAAGAQAAGADR